MKQEDKIWTTGPLGYIILLALGLWIAYDLGESRGMEKIENFYASRECINERMQTMETWLKGMRYALTPNSGVNLSAQEKQEVNNMLFIWSNQIKSSPVEKFCKEVIHKRGPSPSYEFPDNDDIFLSMSTQMKLLHITPSLFLTKPASPSDSKP
jgi:hypothetical protein